MIMGLPLCWLEDSVAATDRQPDPWLAPSIVAKPIRILPCRITIWPWG
jgi:hypothetical protein